MPAEKNKSKKSLFRRIVNIFIAAGLLFIGLIILFIGFSQTRTFRNFIKDNLVKIVNSNTDAKLSIENIEGTILTSVFINKPHLTTGSDTLLNAEKLIIKTSPLQLLLKRIYIREVELRNASINLLQDKNGEWNFSALFKPKEEKETKSEFTFKIIAPRISLVNVNFRMQKYNYRGSVSDYKILNTDDLRIENLNFDAAAFASPSEKAYMLNIKSMSMAGNFNNFLINNLSGIFEVTSKYASVKNLNILTGRSEVKISARFDSLNIFSKINLSDFESYPVGLKAEIKAFDFDDLSSFVGSTEILKGKPSLTLEAGGVFGNIKIDKLSLRYSDTELNLNGYLKNLHRPSELYIDANIKNSSIVYKNVLSLLPSLNLPHFNNLELAKLNIDYHGYPTNFKARLSAETGRNQKLDIDCLLNLNKSPVEYKINFITKNLNLQPVINIPTRINGKGEIAGSSFNLNTLNTLLKLEGTDSDINNIPISNYKINSTASNGEIELEAVASGTAAQLDIKGNLTFLPEYIPKYFLVGRLNNLDLSRFYNDENYKSDLNFYFKADGVHFNPDSIKGTFSFGIDSSSINDKFIDYANLDLKLSNRKDYRAININSDLLDFNIEGNFSLNDAIALINYQTNTIIKIFREKIENVNPINIVYSEEVSDSMEIELPDVIKKEIEFEFNFTFKNFELVAALIGKENLDISGTGYGTVRNKSPNFSINTSMNLDYVILLDKKSTIYLSDVDADINFIRNNYYNSFDKLFGIASFTSKRFYSGTNVENITADLVFNQSKLFYNLSADIEDYASAHAEGYLTTTPTTKYFNISNLVVRYKEIEWKNKDTIKAVYDDNNFRFDNLNLWSDTTFLAASGFVDSRSNQKISIELKKLSGKILSSYFLGGEDPLLNINCNLSADIGGSLNSPLIKSKIDFKSIYYSDYNLGKMEGNLSYGDKIISVDFVFMDSTFNYNKPVMTIKGTIPYDLAFTKVDERVPADKEMSISIFSDNFNLKTLGKILPGIEEQDGLLLSDIKLRGRIDNPRYYGNLSIINGSFKFLANNINYNFGLHFRLNEQKVDIDTLYISNTGGTKSGGTIYGIGSILMEGFSLKNLSVKARGKLTILNENSKAVSPQMYGNLTIETDPEWLLTWRDDRIFIQGNVVVDNANLFYTLGEETGGTQKNDYRIVFLVDSSKIDKELLKFQEVLEQEKKIRKDLMISRESSINVDYSLGIRVPDRAQLVFILSQVANQKLIVETRGDMTYESLSGNTRAQGVFELLNGSKLEFFKTFDAEGFIRFESSISEPYLDITATYQNDYVPPSDPNATPEEVAIKIFIKGPLSSIGRNLVNNSESIAIYVGKKNIQNNVRETKYDYSDAFSFILFGKFKNDLTAEDRAETAGILSDFQSTATSFLGSLLTNFVNSAVGDLVNNIQISRTGEQTKFRFSGKIQNLRYSFGGTTEVFQNINKANIKIEYPFNPSFLIRLERKDPIIQTPGLDEKVNELALKYKFEF
ncbi:hypothetical protein [Melioribacter sp. OK-6-Me]|uniref:translocation/assembly module TamB domain-containing protein n=1 Tax=unclassified Melioribacter TaxID=2627329 RepID=UPI003EDA86FF